MEKCLCWTYGCLPCTFNTLQVQMRKARVKREGEAEPKALWLADRAPVPDNRAQC